MEKEYIIYCDESINKGQYFSNFYGGALVGASAYEMIEGALKSKKQDLNFFEEVKWGKVTSNYLDKYVELVDYFFAFVKSSAIKVRIMFTHNIYIPNNLNDYQKEYEYFILYQQFLKHAFGLHFANYDKQTLKVRVMLDRLPVRTKEKIEIFKSYIHGISNSPNSRNANVIIPKNQIAEVDSKDHTILQCLDVVLGAMQFRLNDKHLEKSQETKRRGKRTIARESLYKHINKKIKEIYPNFNIGKSTGKNNKMENTWLHPYRHWLFEPKDKKIDLSKGKKKNQQQ